MKFLATVGVSTLLLMGCGIGEKMDSANAEVRKTNKKLNQTNSDHRLSKAAGWLFDEERAPSIRGAAAETVFKLSEDRRIGKYLGTPTLLKFPIGPNPLNRSSRMPNVALVAEKSIGMDLVDKGLFTLGDNVYTICREAIERLIDDMLMAAANPSQKQQDEKEVQELAERFFNVATALVGAIEITDIPPVDSNTWFLDDTLAKPEYDEAEKQALACKLYKIASVYGVSDQARRTLDQDVELRLGLNKDIVMRDCR